MKPLLLSVRDLVSDPDQTKDLNQVTVDPLLILLNNFREKLTKVWDGDTNGTFERLNKNVPIAREFAPSLDYKDFKCNGFRLILSQCEAFLKVALKKRRPSDHVRFFEVVKIMDLWFDCLVMRTTVNSTNFDDYPEQTMEYYRKILLGYNPDAVALILGPDYHMVCCPKAKFVFNVLERGIIFCIGKKFSHKMRMLTLSNKKRARTVAKLGPTVTVTEVAKTIRLMNSWILRAVYGPMRAVTDMKKGRVQVKPVEMNVPTKFEILVESTGIRIVCVDREKNNDVKYRMLQYKPQEVDPKNCTRLVFYVHGGAFVGPDASACDNMYLKEMCNYMPGIAILSMDHPPGPENPFPIAIQKVLDLWLWINDERNEESVTKKIGFFPKEIVLMGDSSGGSIVSSLMVVLNEIKRNTEFKFEPKFPKSLTLFFPKVSLQPDIFPSLMASIFDPLISTQLLAAATIAYVPLLKRDANGNWNLVKDNLTVPMDFILSDDYKLIQSPILSPIRYQHLEDFAKVPLFIMSIFNDPLMDESIEFARQWKVPVHMTVIDGLPHGAWIFNYFCSLGAECVKIGAQMLTDAFEASA